MVKRTKANPNCFQILNEDEQRNKHEVRERENARADENASNRLKGGARAREGQITRVGCKSARRKRRGESSKARTREQTESSALQRA